MLPPRASAPALPQASSEISRVALHPHEARLGERARCEIGLDRAPRDECDAVAAEHRAPGRLLQAELERDEEIAQSHAAAPQLVLDDLPHPCAFLHQDQRLAAELVDDDRAAGERVPRRADEDHLVAEQRLEPDAAMAAGGTDDAELEPRSATRSTTVCVSCTSSDACSSG